MSSVARRQLRAAIPSFTATTQRQRPARPGRDLASYTTTAHRHRRPADQHRHGHRPGRRTAPPGTIVTGSNPANYFGDTPAIQIVKFVNGQDADTPTGALVCRRQHGDLHLRRDQHRQRAAGQCRRQRRQARADSPASPATRNGNGLLDLTETWTFTATATARPASTPTSAPSPARTPSTGTTVTDTNPDNYFGDAPAIRPRQARQRPGRRQPDRAARPRRQHGDLHLRGDQHRQRAAGRRRRHATTSSGRSPTLPHLGGDTNGNGLLDLTETWTFTRPRTATGRPVHQPRHRHRQDPDTRPAPVTDNNPDNHFGDVPGISIVKLVNGKDNDTPDRAASCRRQHGDLHLRRHQHRQRAAGRRRRHRRQARADDQPASPATPTATACST